MTILTNVLRWRYNVDKIRSMYVKNLKPKTNAHKVLKEKEVEEFNKLFKYFDKNRDAYLDSNEYNNLVKHESRFQLSNPGLRNVFNTMDINNDGRVSIYEFLEHKALHRKKLPKQGYLEEMFYSYDRNNDGHINLDEMRTAWLQLGEDPGREDLRNLFVNADEDRDGLINLYQFIDLIKQHSQRGQLEK